MRTRDRIETHKWEEFIIAVMVIVLMVATFAS